MSNYIWIGPRESDIEDCKELFIGSITIFGSNGKNNISYCKSRNIRIDHNIPNIVENDFWISNIKKFKEKYSDIKLVYYNSEFSKCLSPELSHYVINKNNSYLLDLLSDKSSTRIALSSFVDVVPFQNVVVGSDLNLISCFPNYNKLIFQEIRSSGGNGTHIVDITNRDEIIPYMRKNLLISPYIENSVPINIHLLIGQNDVLVFPGSIQITQKINNKILYLGADYIAYSKISKKIREQIRKNSKLIGAYLQKLGYIGVLGIDYLITSKEVLFVEINARYQASTPILNKALKQAGLNSIQYMNTLAFAGQNLPEQKIIDNIQVPYSFISYIEGTWKKPFSMLNNIISSCGEIEKVCYDGFSEDNIITANSYLFKIIFNTNCVSISPETTLNIYENLIDIENDFYNLILDKSPLEIKISLLNQGVNITDSAKEHLNEIGEIRDAVFSAVDITIFNDLHINCPKKLKFSFFSPWIIDLSGNNELWLYYYKIPLCSVEIDIEDKFCNNTTDSSIKFSRICFWATDRLRIHHNLTCSLKKQGAGCKFCEIVPCNENLSLNDIFMVIDHYIDNANTFNHFLIGGGSEPRDMECKRILEIVKHIRTKSDKKIYVMSLPPKDHVILKDYFNAGVTQIGFNIEIFDQKNALNIMPGKGKITRTEYFEALKKATTYWGKTGNVRSLIIVGLESTSSLISGIEKLCQLGVMPILSIFRPIPGTDMENVVPPSNDFLKEVYTECENICTRYNLHLGPDCTFCQNNTLSLPFWIQ